MSEMSEAHQRLLRSGGLEFPPQKYVLTFRCTRCGHSWEKISLVEDDASCCPMGCGDFPEGLISTLVRIFGALLAGKPFIGQAELVKTAKLPREAPRPLKPI